LPRASETLDLDGKRKKGGGGGIGGPCSSDMRWGVVKKSNTNYVMMYWILVVLQWFVLNLQFYALTPSIPSSLEQMSRWADDEGSCSLYIL